MKKILTSLAVLIIATISLQAGNQRIEEERKVPDFTVISIRSSVDVVFRQASAISVTVVAEEKEIDKIITKVKGDALIVDYEGNMNISWWGSDSEKSEVIVTAPDLEKVHIAGSGDFETEGVIEGDEFVIEINGSGDFESRLDVKDLEVQVSGSGDCEFSGVNNSARIRVNGSGDVECEEMYLANLKVEQYGSGDVSAKGSANSLYLKQAGSGDFSGRMMETKSAELNKSGSGDAVITVTEELVVNSHGSGDTYCYGNPGKVNESVHGSGDLVIK